MRFFKKKFYTDVFFEVLINGITEFNFIVGIYKYILEEKLAKPAFSCKILTLITF